MAVQKLNNFHAFKPGSDIWFLPEKKLSLWARSLDWYVNFLYSRAQKNTKKQLNQAVKTIIKDEEMELGADFTADNHVLLLSSNDYLPNRALAFVKNVNDVPEWFQWISKTTQNLKSYSIRIFLPKGLTYTEVQKLCQSFPDNIDITVVEDGTLYT